MRASARCTAVTSCPASTARAIATAESTPPETAASTCRSSIGSALVARLRLAHRPDLTGPPRARLAGTARPRRAARRAARPRRPGSSCGRARTAASRGRAPGRAPIASSTWLGWATPAEQAEPVEHSTPRASSSMSSESPSQPGNEKCALPGSRSTGSPDSTASGTAGQHAGDQVVAQRRHPGGGLRPGRDRGLGRHREPDDRRGVCSVPERTSRSWPPPCSSGVHVHVPAEHQRAGADRAAELVPGQGQRVHPGRGRRRPAARRPPAPRRCGTAPRARRRPRPARPPAARCRPRCWPTSP